VEVAASSKCAARVDELDAVGAVDALQPWVGEPDARRAAATRHAPDQRLLDVGHVQRSSGPEGGVVGLRPGIAERGRAVGGAHDLGTAGHVPEAGVGSLPSGLQIEYDHSRVCRAVECEQAPLAVEGEPLDSMVLAQVLAFDQVLTQELPEPRVDEDLRGSVGIALAALVRSHVDASAGADRDRLGLSRCSDPGKDA
jgi:hypothetical protein